MKDLNEIREEIDNIDNEIIKLYEKRMTLIKEVTLYKIKNNLAIYDSSRESNMLTNNTNKIQNDEYKKYYKDILLGFLKASKDYQNDLMDN